MIKCVYCNNNEFESDNGSEEHAILSALGGRKASRNICCEACNNRLGDEIDKVLTNELSVLSNLLGIKTGRNKKAKTFRQIVEKDGRKMDLLPGGKVQYSKPVIQPPEDKEAKTINFELAARNPVEAKKLLEQFLAGHGKTLDDVNNCEIKSTSDYDKPIMDFNIQINDGPFFRSIAKMMLTYLATLSAQPRIRDGSCNEMINYINGIDEEDFVIGLDYNSKFPIDKLLCIFEHKIFIRAEKSSKIVYCGLQLFGYLRFSAVISVNWNGGDISKCYIVDPVAGKGEDFEFDTSDNLQTIIKCRGVNESQFKESVHSLYNLINEMHQKTSYEDLIHTAITEFFALSEYDELIEEELGLFVETIIKHFQGMMFNTNVVQELTLAQLKKLK